MLFVVIWFILRILSVDCDLNLVDPASPKFSDIDFNIARMLSSASPYRIEDNVEEECTPIKAWLLVRHGSKYPPEQTLNAINKQLVPVIQKLVADLYANESDMNFTKLLPNQKRIIRKIINWKNVLAAGSHKNLSEAGKLFMQDLGKRWNAKLKKLTKHLKVDEVEILAAAEDRCVITGKKFMSTFFEGDYDELDVIRNTFEDRRLKLEKTAAYKVKVVDPSNPADTMYVEDLYFRQNCPPITKRIQKLLFPDHIKDYQIYRNLITNDIVKTMYEACSYSYHYFDDNGTKTDAWCWLFRYEDLKMFEEKNDLRYYYKYGYHVSDNLRMGNAIADDLLQFLKNSKGLKFKLFIGHTSNVLSVISRFNLFRDAIALTVDNIQRMTDRKWKSSFMTPLGCNIMVVVYDCGYKTLKLTVYINEKPVQMVTNDGKTCTKCPIDEVKRLIAGFKTRQLSYSVSNISWSGRKKKDKEEKLKIMKLEKEKELMKLAEERELERWNNAFHDEEDYRDRND